MAFPSQRNPRRRGFGGGGNSGIFRALMQRRMMEGSRFGGRPQQGMAAQQAPAGYGAGQPTQGMPMQQPQMQQGQGQPQQMDPNMLMFLRSMMQ